MSIEQRVEEARQIGDGSTIPPSTPEISPELIQGQEESLRILGEKIGFAVEELTGINFFNPVSETDVSLAGKEWSAKVLSPSNYYDFRHIKFTKKIIRWNNTCHYGELRKHDRIIYT